MTFRQWLAWRLVRIAHRIHDAEYTETITMVTPSGAHNRINVVGDEYGCGIRSTSGIAWDPSGEFESAEIEGWHLAWDTEL